jgi:hypothetical protein
LQTVGLVENTTIGKVVECDKYVDGFTDLEFICATANLIPLLIEDWEKQRAENAKLKGLLKRAKDSEEKLSAEIKQALTEGTTETMNKDSGEAQ